MRRSRAQSCCQDCACHMTAVCSCCGYSTACEVWRQFLDEVTEHLLGFCCEVALSSIDLIHLISDTSTNYAQLNEHSTVTITFDSAGTKYFARL